MRSVLLIPALEPEESLVGLVKALRAAGFERIIAIDDGSASAYAAVFERAEREGCVVARHPQNFGKGAALKTGVRAAIERYGRGNAYVTADADGQHLPEDIAKVARALERHPDALVLGVRDFGARGVPPRSWFGNRITSLVFRLTSGVACPDTQTGLRGIPACLEDFALSAEGERYEYEMNFLSDAARRVPFRFVPIQTVYRDANRASHFRTVADSARVYGRFLRFLGASLAGAAVDYLLFFLFSHILPLPDARRIVLAFVAARLCSGAVNFLLNRRWGFRSANPAGGDALRYAVLFLVQMGASAALVALLSMLLPELLAKLVVDTALFFISYILQKNWVFRRPKMRG